MYKEAIKSKFRFQTSKGLLTTEQLWDLSMTELDTLVVSLESEMENSGKKSYLKEQSTEDLKLKKKFEIALDILKTKIAEDKERVEAVERKKRNSQIDEIILRKEGEALEKMSIEDLKKMRE